MKILITPPISKKANSTIAPLIQNIINQLNQSGHIVAICAGNTSFYHNARFYNAPVPKEKFHLFNKITVDRTIEESLFSQNILEKKYLQADMKYILEAIQEFQPDIVLELNRPAALIITKKYHLPCTSIIHAADYRNRNFNKEVLSDLNSTLREESLEQILKYVDLRNHCNQFISFGPMAIQAFPPSINVTHIGNMSIETLTQEFSNHIYVSLKQCSLSSRKIKKILQEAYCGAPYTVYAHYSNAKSSVYENIQFLQTEKLQYLNGSEICIHDGDEYIFNQCLALAIPQLIIFDQNYLRSWNATASNRQGFGISLNASMFTMENLYETHRRILSDDYYKQRALQFQKELQNLGNIAKLLISITQ